MDHRAQLLSAAKLHVEHTTSNWYSHKYSMTSEDINIRLSLKDLWKGMGIV
jgi:hypothetical protein